MPQHYCKMCQGRRDNNGLICLGCGTELSKCSGPTPQRKQPRCPKCRSGSGREIEFGRYCCNNCQAIYEAADVSFLDDRPHVNLEKLERMEREIKESRRP